MNFKDIFDRHFFSNHHLEAKRLESRLEAIFAGCECITFASLEGLITAVLDELCVDSGTSVNMNWNELKIKEFNAFCHATERKGVGNWNDAMQTATKVIFGNTLFSMEDYLQGALIHGDRASGLLLEFAQCSNLLDSAAVFVTRDATLAEKLRWSRSSYGRRAAASIKIAGNGRFSELQGQLINSALDDAGYGG
jgi:hypothetical protein